MTRYFTQFSNSRPMTEIDEAEARARDSYAEAVDDSPARFRAYVDGELHKIVYAGWTEPSGPLADFCARREGVRGEIYGPPRRDDGTITWRTWHLDPSGAVGKILEPVHRLDDGRFLTERCYGPDGALRSYDVYHYADDGELVEVVTHAPDGAVRSRQRA